MLQCLSTALVHKVQIIVVTHRQDSMSPARANAGLAMRYS